MLSARWWKRKLQTRLPVGEIPAPQYNFLWEKSRFQLKGSYIPSESETSYPEAGRKIRDILSPWPLAPGTGNSQLLASSWGGPRRPDYIPNILTFFVGERMMWEGLPEALASVPHASEH